MACFSPLKGWKSRHNGGLTFDRSEASEKMDVACGQCLGCRVQRASHWTMRILAESSLHEYNYGNSFVTLTYRDPEECNTAQLSKGYHVPSDWSLHDSHLTKFLKRLRSAFPAQKIRYYAVGEYGVICRHRYDVEVYKHDCKTGRPHFHLCLFGFRPDDGTQVGPELYDSPTLEKLWPYGFVSWGDVTPQSAAYVARYCLKKLTGHLEDQKYLQFNEDLGQDIWLMQEFARMSLRPGIGADWFAKYCDDVYPADHFPMLGEGGVKKGVPRYFDKLLEEVDPELFDKVKEGRQKYYREHKDEFSPQRLESAFKCLKAKQALFSNRGEI